MATPRNLTADFALEIARERAHDIARDLKRRKLPKVLPTGLRKLCPRCSRLGFVFFVDSAFGPGPSFLVVWNGKPRGTARRADTHDLSTDELVDPNSGCGYDRPKK